MNGRWEQTATEESLDAAKKNLVTVRLRFIDQHPDVVAVYRQIAELEAAVAVEEKEHSGSSARGSGSGKRSQTNPVYEQLKIRLGDAESNAAASKRRVDDTRAQLAQLEKTASCAPGIEAKATHLDGDYGVIKHNY